MTDHSFPSPTRALTARPEDSRTDCAEPKSQLPIRLSEAFTDRIGERVSDALIHALAVSVATVVLLFGLALAGIALAFVIPAAWVADRLGLLFTPPLPIPQAGPPGRARKRAADDVGLPGDRRPVNSIPRGGLDLQLADERAAGEAVAPAARHELLGAGPA